MDRKQVIFIILKNSELFTKTELLSYTNEHLYYTFRALFLELRIKQKK